jgi:DNA repair exonuclease SbcCD ATPase subunit
MPIDNKVDIDTSGPAMDVDIPEEKDTAEIEQSEVKEEPTVRPVVEETTETETEVKVEEKKEEPKEEKEKELEQYSESVQRRIAKLTHKWREAQRQADEATEYAKAQIKLKEQAEAKISKLEPGYLQSTEDSITSGIQAAQAKLAAAREAQDLSAEAEALTAISELGYKKAKLEETKVAQEEFKKNKKAEPELKLDQKQTASNPAPDPKAEAWAAKNSWFGTDNAMTYTAFDLHKTLTEKEGFDPQTDEYYQEIDKRIRLEFPHKFDTTTSDKGEVSAKPVQTVASAKRSTNTGRKTVRLTSSQVAIAKKLGVPLEEYAKQLKITKEV